MVKRVRPMRRRALRPAAVRRAPRPAITEQQAAAAFVAESRRRLGREYLPKLRHVLRGLTPEDLWWRPNPTSNSIANLLLHLDGNVRQWIVAGIGGAPDERDRDAEFLASGGANARTLLAHLTRTLREVDAVLARIGPETLLERRVIQGYPVTGLQAVYHVVEHFSGHTGQILYIAKLRLERDLALYTHLDGARRRKPAGAGRRRADAPRRPRRKTAETRRRRPRPRFF
jgi:uncharacterized damage-inducible protein DinB